MTDTRICPGPLVWFDLADDPDHPAAVLECGAPGCDYVIATGSFNDVAHSDAPLIRSGE